MYKIYITLFFLLFWVFSNTIYATEDKIGNITEIIYDWYLNDDSVIQIIWSNFLNCTDFKINRDTLLVNSIDEKKITYKYSKNISNSGNISFKCNNNLVSSNFSFPYLSNATFKYLTNGSPIKISWNNFDKNSTVHFESWEKLFLTNVFDSTINWKLPKIITWDKIFIKSWKLLSNIYDLNIEIPKINYIYSEWWFKYWNKLTIYWINLNSYKNTYINFWSTKLKNFTYDKFNWTLQFIIPKEFWSITLSVTSNWITSNKLKFNISWWNPSIESIYIRWFNIIEYWKKIYKEKLIIKWENFETNIKNFTVYMNWKLLFVNLATREKLTIDNFKFDDGNNYIYIETNWNQSNILNYYIKYAKPYISYIRPDNIVDEYRNIYVWIWNFDLEKDTLYFNNSPIKIKSCIDTRCRVQINKSILKWSFSIGLNNNLKTLKEDFNINIEKIPVINNIYFYWELNTWTKFIINGNNFLNADIKLDNLVSIDSKWRYNYSVSSNTIKWSLKNWYDKTKDSIISVTKYWSTANLKFKWLNIKWNSVNWVWIIDNIYLNNNKKDLFKPWYKLKIKWRWFHPNDSIIIWTDKTLFEYINSWEWNFIIPDRIKPWKYLIQIKNNEWLLSKWFSIIISDINSINEVSILWNNNTKSSFNINSNYKNEKLFSFNINNKLNDFIIKNLKFNFTSIDNISNLGTFYLKNNWTIIAESLVDDKWLLTFNNILLKKDYKDTSLNLVKSSFFIDKWEYYIDLDNIDLYFKWTNKKFTNINRIWLNKKRINIYDKSSLSCIDSLNDNSYCNSHWLIKKKLIIKPVKNTVKSNVKLTKKPSNNIYSKIDVIISDLINKNSNKSLLDQLNFYKDFRFKLNKILFKYNKHKLSIYLEYFYTKIDNKYKKVFKEYILSKK